MTIIIGEWTLCAETKNRGGGIRITLKVDRIQLKKEKMERNWGFLSSSFSWLSDNSLSILGICFLSLDWILVNLFHVSPFLRFLSFPFLTSVLSPIIKQFPIVLLLITNSGVDCRTTWKEEEKKELLRGEIEIHNLRFGQKDYWYWIWNRPKKWISNPFTDPRMFPNSNPDPSWFSSGSISSPMAIRTKKNKKREREIFSSSNEGWKFPFKYELIHPHRKMPPGNLPPQFVGAKRPTDQPPTRN